MRSKDFEQGSSCVGDFLQQLYILSNYAAVVCLLHKVWQLLAVNIATVPVSNCEHFFCAWYLELAFCSVCVGNSTGRVAGNHTDR
jgi:hypothetical protein